MNGEEEGMPPPRQGHVPGHATARTKTNKPILPTNHQTAILRRIARGFLLVTLRQDDDPLITYEDGTRISFQGVEKPMDQVRRWVRNGWLIPDRGDSLYDFAEAQVYRARTL